LLFKQIKHSGDNFSYVVADDPPRDAASRIAYSELEYALEGSGTADMAKEIFNDRVYGVLKALTDRAYPTSETEYDRRWSHFILPLKRRGRLIAIPFEVMEYEGAFFIFFRAIGLRQMCVKRGSERVSDIYERVFREAMEFIDVIEGTGRGEVLKLYPYDLRSGRIKGKHVMERTMPAEEARRILADYRGRGRRATHGVSLNEYLRVAGICYRAAFGDRAGGLTDEGMYGRWADGRNCGMLEIEDRESEEAFARWLREKSHCGGHPFEIVFSWHGHGIILYPPYERKRSFSIGVGNYVLAEVYLRMVDGLIRSRIPFVARDLKDVLNYLKGESYFKVNSYGDLCNTLFYSHTKEEREQYFRHIEWDSVGIVRFKPPARDKPEG